MKRTFASLITLVFVCTANAQVFINEFFANAPGADTGNEYFELRGTPSLSLSGYYLLSLEGQGTTLRGDVNQFFDLGSFSIGANGYLFARQAASQFAVQAGATLVENTIGTGWGQVNVGGSSAGHSSDGTQVDLENSATTILLINIGSGTAPTLTTDLDTDDDGLLNLPAEWSVVDSVGVMDGVSGAATDFSYGSITLRAGALGTNVVGNVIDVPAGTGTGFYVGRIGDSTGSTANDWFGAVVNGTAGSPLNFLFTSASDLSFASRPLTDMNFGGVNPIPEPGLLALLGLGCLGFLLRRRIR